MMKNIFFIFILLFIKLNISCASLANLPSDIKNSVYDKAPVIVRGKIIEISFLFRRDGFGKKPIKKIDNLVSKLYQAQNIFPSMPQGFYIIKIELKEVLKNNSIIDFKKGDIIYTTFIEYNTATVLSPKEKEEYWAFLETSAESTLKTLSQCFKRIKKEDSKESPFKAPEKTLYFYGIGEFPLLPYAQEAILTKTIYIINEVYQIEDTEEQSNKWKELQLKYKENSFLQHPWEESDDIEDFNY